MKQYMAMNDLMSMDDSVAEDEGFDLFNVALRRAVARNCPLDSCI